MRDDQGTRLDSAPVASTRSRRTKRKQTGRRATVQPGPDSATVAIPCLHDPAKDCVLCSEFDECTFVDRRSSLNSVAFSLVFSVIVAFLALIWFFFLS